MNPISRKEASGTVKKTAYDLGFSFCGISNAVFLDKEAPRLETWLKHNYHGKMHYMANNFDKRLNPVLLFPGAKSVISLGYNYYPSKSLQKDGNFKLSKYAYGKDYHKVIHKKLKEFLRRLKDQFGDISGRGFVDSAPVLEKAWAVRSGLGWYAKNTQVINKNLGSFFFLAELIIDLELQTDGPVKDYCGTCTRCIDACPTQALQPYLLDATKCISYLTIELKDRIPSDFKGKMNGWIFGCDICQDVCPWNRHSKPHNENLFDPNPGLKEMDRSKWEEINEEIFDRIFEGSAVKRTGFEGLKRNIRFVRENDNS